ncbi:hypothetical protein HSRCO_0309 [Halanaeroarchaeum sp. HSR-CO]|nr:hypothetical protein HSRCO_0309 [Halanaeroarchaeum sp. HSR-CO]
MGRCIKMAMHFRIRVKSFTKTNNLLRFPHWIFGFSVNPAGSSVDTDSLAVGQFRLRTRDEWATRGPAVTSVAW